MTQVLGTPFDTLASNGKRGEPAWRQAERPRVSPVLTRFFYWYTCRYLRHHFNAVRLAKQTTPDLPPDEAVICFGNHPGWWDPLIALLLNRLYLDGRTAYAPIDKAALDKYPIFRKLGFYGIDLDSLDGARQFLRTTRELLRCPHAAVWMTPGGTFADVRARTRFQPGLGHLAANLDRVTLLPVAVEYTFWEERTPETLVAFGEPISTTACRASKEHWQSKLEDRLAEAQASLAAKAMSRDPDQFEIALEGTAGVSRCYDFWRHAKAMLMGRDFDSRHGKK